MDPARLAEALERTTVKAILPVHVFGGMADMPRILEIANRRGVPVVEDAACALGAEIGGRQAGAWGVMGCFSFHPRKAITTGEGGIITTDDAALARHLRILRNHGLDPDAPAPDFVAPGYNVRLTEFQAALGSSQMVKLQSVVESRRRAATIYDRLLEGTEITSPGVLDGSCHVYQSYVVQLPDGAAVQRADVIAALRQRGIETTIGTYHIPLTTFYRSRYKFDTGDFPVTDDVAARSLSLPVYQSLTREQQERIVIELRQVLADVCGSSVGPADAVTLSRVPDQG
jgi:dTDP-4-amino-4,6-dideoxygalactose transaminase